MQSLLPGISQSSTDPASSASSSPAPRAQAPKSAPKPAVPEVPVQHTEKQPVAAVAETDQTNVSFRRDPNGRVYYVLTDANSGKELEELPPGAVRKVGQGIEDYLKQQQARAVAHVEVKA